MAESESVEVNEEVREEVKEEVKEEAWSEDMPSGSSIEDAVDKLLEALNGYVAKYNLKQAISVIDLKHRSEPQGTRFRQVHVQRGSGTLTVSLVESFKSAHGGNEETKSLYSFSVSITDAAAYTKLEQWFFGYSAQKNVNEAAFLLKELKTTLR